MDARTTVAERLAYLCRKKGMRPNALANFAGVPPMTLYSILNAKSKNPGVVTLKKLCDGLGISLTEFFDTETFKGLEQEIC